MWETIWGWVTIYIESPWYHVVTFLCIMMWVVLDIRRWYRERVGKDITLCPQLTLTTDDGDKIHVLSVNEEQGRYVLYHSRTKGLQLATERQFMKLKGGSDARS